MKGVAGTKKKHFASQIILHIVIIVLLFLMLYPLFIAVFIGMKSLEQYKYTPWLPTLPLWVSNFKIAFVQIGLYIFNTIFVAVFAVLGLLFVSSISAYTFARLKFPGREQIYIAVIALMMVPGILTLVPTYMVYNSLHLLNTRWVLIVPVVFGGSVGGVFLLRAFFSGIPEDIFEAARIDGCSEFQSYIKICLPLSKPILGTLAIQTIVGIWNDIVWPIITIQNSKLWTVSAGIFLQFQGQFSSNVPIQFSGYILASLPLVILFMVSSRHYIEGLTSAGLKL